MGDVRLRPVIHLAGRARLVHHQLIRALWGHAPQHLINQLGAVDAPHHVQRNHRIGDGRQPLLHQVVVQFSHAEAQHKVKPLTVTGQGFRRLRAGDPGQLINRIILQAQAEHLAVDLRPASQPLADQPLLLELRLRGRDLRIGPAKITVHLHVDRLDQVEGRVGWPRGRV